MQSTHAQARSAQTIASCQEALAQANKRKEPEEIFEEAAKLAEQTQPVVTVAPVAKEAGGYIVKKNNRPDKERRL